MYSVSRRLHPVVVGSAFVLAFLLSLDISGSWGAPHAERADTGRVVSRITVSNQGIQINGSDRSAIGAAKSADSSDVSESVSIDGGRHRVRIGRMRVEDSRSGKRVQVGVPGIRVEGEGAGLVRVFADAEVPAGNHVDGDVVAVFGSVTVAGQVSGSVVAVLGNVRLAPGAVVNGDAVAVGGSLEQPAGAMVTGQSVSLGFLPIAWGLPGLPIVVGAILVTWLANLLMGWLFHLMFRRRMLRIAYTASRRTGWSLLLGLFSAPLLVVAMVLLLITVLGIPIAVLLPLCFALLSWAGQIAASYVIGCKLLRRPLDQGGGMLPLAAGTLFVAAFFVAGSVFGAGLGFSRPLALFCYLLGALLLMGLTTIGTGAALISRLGGRGPELESSGFPGPGFRPATAPPGTSGQIQ